MVTSRTLSVINGTEGPYHDPYGYEDRYISITMMLERLIKEGGMEPKTITIDMAESLVMDADGKWTLIDTDCGLREPITEREAIDVLERRAKRNPSLKPLLPRHFPMRNFHAAPKADRTPTHKADAY